MYVRIYVYVYIWVHPRLTSKATETSAPRRYLSGSPPVALSSRSWVR